MLKRCEFIGGMNISYDDEQRVVIIDNHALSFGACQYTLVSLLLANREVRDEVLSQALYQQEASTENRESVMKHMSKLRARLRVFELDIKRIYDEGYKLVALAKKPEKSPVDMKSV